MKLKSLLFSTLTLLLVSVMSSCSGHGDILETIPADATMVATVNTDKLCTAAGVTVKDDGSIEAIDPMKQIIEFQGLKEIFQTISALRPVADIDNVVVAMDTDGNPFATLAINSFDDVKAALGDRLSWNSAAGYQMVRTDMATLMVKGKQMWALTETRDAAKSLDAILKSASEMSVAKLDGITEALSRDNIANIAVASGFATLTTSKKSNTEIPAQDKLWNVAALLEGADNSLVLEWETMQSTGRSVKPEGFQTINPALLAYVPQNFNIALAAGITPGFDWEPLRKLIYMAGGFQTAAFMSVVNPYLEAIDGTVLLAAGPSSPEMLTEGDLSDWDFIALVHMPQGKINALMNMVANMMSTAGMAPTTTADGLLAIPQYGKTLYIGNVDGYLGVSTIAFDNTRNNSLAPIFANKDFAAAASLDPYSAYVPAAPEGTGISLTMSMDNGKGSAKLKVTGSQYPVLPFLLTAAK